MCQFRVWDKQPVSASNLSGSPFGEIVEYCGMYAAYCQRLCGRDCQGLHTLLDSRNT